MKRNLLPILSIGIGMLLLFGLATALLTPKVTADDGAVSAANSLYQAGNYADAIRIYEQLIAQGVQDSAVHYNLGNAYYRQGDLGRAILNYQRATKLDPRDADIKANLELAQAQAQAPFDDAAPGPLGVLAKITSGWLTLNETAVLALAFWFLAGFGLLAWRSLAPGKARAFLQTVAVVSLLLLGLTGFSLGARIYSERSQPEGVVIAPVVAVSSEPGQQFITELSLQSGAAVNLVEIRGDWARLAVPSGAADSWIPVEAVERVASRPFDDGTLL